MSSETSSESFIKNWSTFQNSLNTKLHNIVWPCTEIWNGLEIIILKQLFYDNQLKRRVNVQTKTPTERLSLSDLIFFQIPISTGPDHAWALARTPMGGPDSFGITQRLWETLHTRRVTWVSSTSGYLHSLPVAIQSIWTADGEPSTLFPPEDS